MTSPAVQIAEAFTGSNGAAWPNFDTHYTQTGTFSSGPTENIQTNKGRAAATTSAASTIRRHRTLGLQVWPNYQPYSNKATFVRNTLAVKPGIFCGHGGTDSTANYVMAQAEIFTGKSTTYGLALKQYVSGTYTSLATIATVSGASSTASTMGLALRTWPLANGNWLIQAKLWDTSGGEPAWFWPTTDTAGASGQSGGSLYYIMSAASKANFPTNGWYGMLDECTATSTAYTVDWDDTSSSIYDASPIISTNFGGMTATAVAGSRRYWNAASFLEDNFEKSAIASFWTSYNGDIKTTDNVGYLSGGAAGGELTYNVGVGKTDHYLTIGETASVSSSGSISTPTFYLIKARWADVNNFVAIKFDSATSKFQFVKVVAGVETVVDADIGPLGTYGVFYIASINAVGTTFRVVFKSVSLTVAREYTISDAALQTGTYVKLNLPSYSTYATIYARARVGTDSAINVTNWGGMTATAIATKSSGGRFRTVGGTLSYNGGTISVV